MPQAANCSQRIPVGYANRLSVGGGVLDAPRKHKQSFVGTGLPDGPFEKLVCTCPGRQGRRPLQEIADILSAFHAFVTFHNSFPEMMIKIVKVFVCQSLDLFLTL